MSIQFKEKIINYNDHAFYRANPYANQGYIPPASLKNRKKPQFITQIPQGIDYFDPSHKKLFAREGHKSTIEEYQLLSNPQKYPLQNRLANDIHYHRSLNTVDIEGASVNSKKSMGVKNRIKAQEQMMRENDKIYTPILFTGISEEERRRRLAEDQLERMNSRQRQGLSRQRNYNSQKKLSPPQQFTRNPYIIMKDEQIQINNDIIDVPIEKKVRNSQDIHIMRQNHNQYRKDLQQKRNYYEREEQLLKLLQNHSSTGDSLEGSRRKDISSRAEVTSGTSSYEGMNPELRQIYQKQRKNIEKDLIKKQFRNQIRQLNPTNLSYGGTMIRNSGIFSNLGKNLASG